MLQHKQLLDTKSGSSIEALMPVPHPGVVLHRLEPSQRCDAVRGAQPREPQGATLCAIRLPPTAMPARGEAAGPDARGHSSLGQRRACCCRRAG